MKAILLAAGKGTRLAPITDNRPKHILEIAGKSILQRIMDKIIGYDYIDEILIITHHFEVQVIDHITQHYSDLIGNRIKFVHQQSTNGTGGAVQDALKKHKISNSFLVVYADLILGDGISKILELHGSHVESGCILGTNVKDPQNYGSLQVEGDKVVAIREKQSNAPNDSVINAGVYVFPQKIVSLIDQIKISVRGELELTDIISLSRNSGIEYQLCMLNEGWFDIGRPWELLNANEYLSARESMDYKIFGEVEPGVTIKGNVHLAKNARLLSGTYIEGDVYVSEGAVIGPNCYIRGHTYFGKEVRIGNACEVKNSIIYAGTHAAHLSYIGDSIIGEKCNLGAGTITANLRHDDGNIKFNVKDQRLITDRRKLGVIMGDRVKTGIGVNILPGVKIGSNSRINAAELVSRDIT